MKGKLLRLAPGEVLFNEGDASNRLYIVREGQIEIFRVRENKDVILGKLGPHDVIGTVTLLSSKPRSASARAVTEVKVFAVSTRILKDELKPFPIWVQVIVKDTVARLLHVDDKLVESRLSEAKLLKKIGTPLSHAAQFIHLMVMYAGARSNENEVFGTDNFLATAKKILRMSNRAVRKIYSALLCAGLLTESSREEVDACFQLDDTKRLARLAEYCQVMSRRDKVLFLTAKYPGFLEAFVEKAEGMQAKEHGWYVKELVEEFSEAFQLVEDKIEHEALVSELTSEDIFRAADYPPDSFQFELENIRDRLEFEKIGHRLLEQKQENAA